MQMLITNFLGQHAQKMVGVKGKEERTEAGAFID